MIPSMWNFCKFWVLSSYTQTHGIKGILGISHPKTVYYFMDNSIKFPFFGGNANEEIHCTEGKFSPMQGGKIFLLLF